jgi:hypothetical protein
MVYLWYHAARSLVGEVGPMVSGRTFPTLSLLDFLAYYVPGLTIVVSVLALSAMFELGLERVVATVDGADLSHVLRGTIWALAAFVMPYVMGHIVFPAGYLLGRRFFRGRTFLGSSGCRPVCEYLKKGQYCEIESAPFAQCLRRSLSSDASDFTEFMVVRYRTLGRFCRSMLLPVLLSSAVILIDAGRRLALGDVPDGVVSVVAGLLLALSYLGFGNRFRRYEQRWRNAVCVGTAG